jgi:hypothetical protein
MSGVTMLGRTSPAQLAAVPKSVAVPAAPPSQTMVAALTKEDAATVMAAATNAVRRAFRGEVADNTWNERGFIGG